MPRPGPTLAETLDDAFAIGQGGRPFAERLVHLAAALTNAPGVWLLDGDGATVAAARPGPAPAPGAPGTVAQDVVLDGDRTARLVASDPPGGAMARALAQERLILLAALARLRNAHPDVDAIRRVLDGAAALARDEAGAAAALADALAAACGADFAALGHWTGSRVRDVAISGQSGGGTRATLPDDVGATLRETAARRTATADRAFAARTGSEAGWAIHVATPRRNAHLPSLAAAALSLQMPAVRARRPIGPRLVRLGVAMLVLAGLVAVPLPDGVEASATVGSEARRVVTAPFDGLLREAPAARGDRVVGGETVIAVLDTRDLDVELVAARADYAAALLDREAARAGRDAARLRTAEIEADRLRARIAFLEGRTETATLFAPIDGTVTASDLPQLRGATVRQGQELAEIADPARLELTLLIPQDRVARVSAEAEGVFRPDFDPSLRIPARITRLSPALDPDDRLAAIRATALPDRAADLGALRLGMTGLFVTDRRWVPVGLLAWRAVRDWALLRLWV
ncbi:MAG: HlyD family efflux transporter periplasmic adaptor subunit [Pseudomonadota bacterium]